MDRKIYLNKKHSDNQLEDNQSKKIFSKVFKKNNFWFSLEEQKLNAKNHISFISATERRTLIIERERERESKPPSGNRTSHHKRSFFRQG